MSRSAITGLTIGCITFLALWGIIVLGLANAQAESTEQLKACSEAGGSYIPVDGDPYCLMPGQSLPLPR
jgi:hypothetical protein